MLNIDTLNSLDNANNAASFVAAIVNEARALTKYAGKLNDLRGKADAPGGDGKSVASVRERLGAMAIVAVDAGLFDRMTEALSADTFKKVRPNIAAVVGKAEGDKAGGVFTYIAAGNRLNRPADAKATFALVGADPKATAPDHLSKAHVPAIVAACKAWLAGSKATSPLGVSLSTLRRWQMAQHKATAELFAKSADNDTLCIEAYLRSLPSNHPHHGMDAVAFRAASGGGVAVAQALLAGAKIRENEGRDAEKRRVAHERKETLAAALRLLRGGKADDDMVTAFREVLAAPVHGITAHKPRTASDGRMVAEGETPQTMAEAVNAAAS